MPLSKLDQILKEQLAQLARNQPLKGHELVIAGMKPADGNFGPRFYIAGQGQKEFLRMNSNSYLGLSLHPRVIQSEEVTTKKFGTGPGAVRFISGTYQHHIDLEGKLAAFHHKEKSILFSSAYAAVIGVLVPLITQDTAVISDALNHNSIINAIQLARPAAKGIYKHQDLGDLEHQLQTHHQTTKRAIVITDGIFSMRGDHAPLKEITDLCRQYEACYREGIILAVDDSHGVGAIGKTGRGTEEYTDASVDILIGTLG
ncbi:MAG TPA: aminotransferase class I/II-fold pyridoxal phosphate-dependent enzyme, partial [Balneolales bacterium]|nr:aminotransferase class I/II-fold pyridoxal phosphate-dependent enzyme [Balneolales bacterium]